MSRDLIDLLREWQGTLRKQRSTLKVRPYDCSPHVSGQAGVQVVDLREDEFLKNAMDAITDGSDLEEWKKDDPAVGRPRSFVIEGGLSDLGRIRFYGRITKGKQLSGPGKLIAFFEGDRFQFLEDQRAILINSYDCIEFDGAAYILSPGGFESLFSYEAELKKAASKSLRSVEEFIEPDDLHILQTALASDRNLMRQFAGKIKLNLATADPANVKAAVAKCKLNVEVNEKGGRMKLHIIGGDPKGLVTLLTEKAVSSIASGTPFIAGALTAIGD